MDSVDNRGKIVDLVRMKNQREGTVTLHFTPTALEHIQKVFLLDFVSQKSRVSLFMEMFEGEPYLSIYAKGDEHIEWKQRVEWKNNQKVFIAVTWNLKDGDIKLYLDEQPFMALNLKALGLEDIGQKLVIGSDYENHYPGNFHISM